MMGAKVIRLFGTDIWIEDDVDGSRAVMIQHDGCEPFEYAVFNYDYRYTSNSGTHMAAHALAVELGAREPVRHVPRKYPRLSESDIREHIEMLQEELARLEAERGRGEG